MPLQNEQILISSVDFLWQILYVKVSYCPTKNLFKKQILHRKHKMKNDNMTFSSHDVPMCQFYLFSFFKQNFRCGCCLQSVL